MSNYFTDQARVTDPLGFDFSEAVEAVYVPGKPIDVKRVVIVLKEASTVGAQTVTIAVRKQDGTSSVTVGTFSIPVAPINSVFKVELGGVSDARITSGAVPSQPSVTGVGYLAGYLSNRPGGVVEVDVGEEIVAISDGAGATAGNADLFFEYFEQSNVPFRFEPTALTFTRS